MSVEVDKSITVWTEVRYQSQVRFTAISALNHQVSDIPLEKVAIEELKGHIESALRVPDMRRVVHQLKRHVYSNIDPMTRVLELGEIDALFSKLTKMLEEAAAPFSNGVTPILAEEREPGVAFES
jgi:hypothetical protein